MHKCPQCGAETPGSWSDGGVLWAICEECMDKIRAPRLEEPQGGWDYNRPPWEEQD